MSIRRLLLLYVLAHDCDYLNQPRYVARTSADPSGSVRLEFVRTEG